MVTLFNQEMQRSTKSSEPDIFTREVCFFYSRHETTLHGLTSVNLFKDSENSNWNFNIECRVDLKKKTQKTPNVEVIF